MLAHYIYRQISANTCWHLGFRLLDSDPMCPELPMTPNVHRKIDIAATARKV